MQSTTIRKGKFYNNIIGHHGANSFALDSKKYAIRCDEGDNSYLRIADPGYITTGDFTFTFSMRANDGIPTTGPFALTSGFTSRVHSVNGTMRVNLYDGFNNVVMDSTINVCDGEWHTIIFSADRSGDVELYIDYDVDTLSWAEEVSADISSVGDIESAGSMDDWAFGFDGVARYSGIDVDQIAIFDSISAPSHVLPTAIAASKHLGLELHNTIGITPIAYWQCNTLGGGAGIPNEGSESDVLHVYNDPVLIEDGIM